MLRKIIPMISIPILTITGIYVTKSDVTATTINTLNEPETLTQTVIPLDSPIVALTARFENDEHTYKGYGTGVFISENTILTAAHVVTEDNTKLKEIEFVSNGIIFRVEPEDVIFYNRTFSSANSDDIALIKVRRMKNHKYYNITMQDKLSPIRITGYPADKETKPDLNVGEPYTTTGETITIKRDLWYTTAYTLSGMSGSPLLNDKNEIIGLHVGKATTDDLIDREKKFSTSIKFTKEQLEWIKSKAN